MMTAAGLARRYARALFAITAPQKRSEEVARELVGVHRVLMEHPEAAQLLDNPSLPRDERARATRAVLSHLGSSADVVNFVLLLVDKNRLSALQEIGAELERLADAQLGRVRAEVVSASPLNDEAKKRLQSALRSELGKEVILTLREDPQLLAGIVTRIDSQVYDGSLRGRLERMATALLSRAD